MYTVRLAILRRQGVEATGLIRTGYSSLYQLWQKRGIRGDGRGNNGRRRGRTGRQTDGQTRSGWQRSALGIRFCKDERDITLIWGTRSELLLRLWCGKAGNNVRVPCKMPVLVFAISKCGVVNLNFMLDYPSLTFSVRRQRN